MKKKNKLFGIIAIVAVIGLAVVITACNEDSGTTPEDDPGAELSYTALDTAIANANAAKAGVFISANGSDVASVVKWVTQTVMDTFNTAITTAETARGTATAQSQVNSAVTALNTAITTFNNAKQDGKLAVTDQLLQDLIDEANALKETAVVKTDGSDLFENEYWVTQTEMTALINNINAASGAIGMGNLNTVYTTLNNAMIVFELAKKPGNKEAAGDPCESGHDHTESLVCKRTGCDHQYALGDIGPGGGVIFYVADGGAATSPISHTRPNGFTFYTSATDTTGIKAHYLEAAPANATDRTMMWMVGSTYAEVTGLENIPFTGTGSIGYGTGAPNADQMDVINKDIGMGRKNTALIVAFYSSSSYSQTYLNAARAANNYTGGAADDWFLPSIGELYWLYQNRTQLNDKTDDGITGMGTDYFWSSSQTTETGSTGGAWCQYFRDGNRGNDYKHKSNSVRAVRAF